MDGSKRSSHGNAYFTGFGAAKRIVFFDTLLARLAPDEIEAVLAHELGHFKLRHVIKRRMARARQPGHRSPRWAGWSASRGSTPAWASPVPCPGTRVALVLFMLALPVFTFLPRLWRRSIRAGTNSRPTRTRRVMRRRKR